MSLVGTGLDATVLTLAGLALGVLVATLNAHAQAAVAVCPAPFVGCVCGVVGCNREAINTMGFGWLTWLSHSNPKPKQGLAAGWLQQPNNY